MIIWKEERMRKPSVCVVMSTYNGEKYISDQIESILRQEDVEVKLFIRDDGSTDKTKEIIREYKAENITLCEGENVGAKDSFILAVMQASPAEYYAFSDQDDVWDKDKLSFAINNINQYTSETDYVLYCCKTRLVNSDLRVLGEGRNYSEHSRPFLKGEVQAAAGCTMVFTRQLKVMIEKHRPVVFPMHDAWVSNLCLALGGVICYDNQPHISYRQHENNAVGGSKGIYASVKRRIKFYKKMGSKYHTRMYKELSEAYKDDMPKENYERYKYVCSYDKSLKRKAELLFDKSFWHGRRRWKAEVLALILLNQF